MAMMKIGQRRLLISELMLRGKKIVKLKTAKTNHVPINTGITTCRDNSGINYLPLSSSFTMPLALPKSIWPA